jgi:glycosyltransferase involved in cell wall biosynthesis
MNKFNPLVSIVFTSYNHQEYLRQAIESIINQTYTNLEIIIVDDCSTDGSQEILSTYSFDNRITFNFLKKNTGSYVKASNLGAQISTGDYLLFAQCDDYAEASQVEELVLEIENNNTAGVVYSESKLVDKRGNFISDDYSIREKSFREYCKNTVLIERNKMREFLSYSCVIPNLSAALISKELYCRVGGLSDKYFIAADWDFWLKLTSYTDFIYIRKSLNNFRQHETTIRSSYKISTQILEIHEIIYACISRNQIKGKAKIYMKICAGAVWFSYQVFGFKPSIKVFIQVFRKTFKYEKFNLIYFILGMLKYIYELVTKSKD